MPGTQAGTEYYHPSPILFICRKPYCQQISIITPRNCRLMIMQIKWGIRITCRTYHKWYRRQKHRCDSRYFFPFYRCIFYRFLIERDRGRCSRYIQTSICFHNSKFQKSTFLLIKKVSPLYLLYVINKYEGEKLFTRNSPANGPAGSFCFSAE